MLLPLFPRACEVLPSDFLPGTSGCAWLIILSDALVYPLGFIVGGMAEGESYDGLAAEQRDEMSRLTTLANSAAYLCVPALVPSLFESGGLGHFAGFQVGIAVVALCVNECRSRSVE